MWYLLYDQCSLANLIKFVLDMTCEKHHEATALTGGIRESTDSNPQHRALKELEPVLQ